MCRSLALDHRIPASAVIHTSFRWADEQAYVGHVVVYSEDIGRVVRIRPHNPYCLVGAVHLIDDIIERGFYLVEIQAVRIPDYMFHYIDFVRYKHRHNPLNAIQHLAGMHLVALGIPC